MTDPAERLSAVIVGAGLMGRWHADAARRAGARIVAVVDPIPGRARLLSGSDQAVCETLPSALARGPDVVHICTPAASHVEVCRQAFNAGAHVIVEKPATPSTADAVALQALADATGRLLVPVHQFSFQRGVRQIRARRAELGVIRHVEFATCSAGAAGRQEDRDLIASEIAPHAFSLARALLGEPVADLLWEGERPAPGEWRFTASTSAGCSIGAFISLNALPTFATCRVMGEHGSAVADLFHGFATFERGRASRSYKMVRPIAVGLGVTSRAVTNLLRRAATGERAYPGLRGLVAASYAAIRGSGEAPFERDEVIDVARARDRVRYLCREAGAA